MEIVWKGSGLDGSVANARGPLFIGSHATILGPVIGLREMLSIHVYVHSSLETPSDERLRRTDALFVYDLENPLRLLQLKKCCEYRRKHGGLDSIYGVLRVPDDKLADQVRNELGAQVRLLGEASFGPPAR